MTKHDDMPDRIWVGFNWGDPFYSTDKYMLDEMMPRSEYLHKVKLRDRIEGMKDITGPVEYTGPYNKALEAVLQLLEKEGGNDSTD